MQVRWNNRPRLRFIDPPTPADGTPAGAVVPPVEPLTNPDGTPTGTEPPAPAAPAAPAPGGDPGYPANTPVAEMTDAQQAAYWKTQSRGHEHKRRELAEKVEGYEAANLTEQQKREKQLREEGEVLGAQPFIRQAVRAELRASTGLPAADVDELLRFTDPNSFLTDGAVDDSKIASFATRIGSGPAAPPAAPPASILGGLSSQAQPRSGATPPQTSSLADKKKAARERLQSKGRTRTTS